LLNTLLTGLAAALGADFFAGLRADFFGDFLAFAMGKR
jgi:hypothetical protein